MTRVAKIYVTGMKLSNFVEKSQPFSREKPMPIATVKPIAMATN